MINLLFEQFGGFWHACFFRWRWYFSRQMRIFPIPRIRRPSKSRFRIPSLSGFRQRGGSRTPPAQITMTSRDLSGIAASALGSSSPRGMCTDPFKCPRSHSSRPRTSSNTGLLPSSICSCTSLYGHFRNILTRIIQQIFTRFHTLISSLLSNSSMAMLVFFSTAARTWRVSSHLFSHAYRLFFGRIAFCRIGGQFIPYPVRACRQSPFPWQSRCSNDRRAGCWVRGCAGVSSIEMRNNNRRVSRLMSSSNATNIS